MYKSWNVLTRITENNYLFLLDEEGEDSLKEDQVEDSNEAKALVGKPIEEIKLRRLMKQKLQVTSIPDLDFEDIDGNVYKFSDFYDYHKFLGSGSFGFVVSAIDKESGEHLALKVSPRLLLNIL